jgi:hypothetical protein
VCDALKIALVNEIIGEEEFVVLFAQCKPNFSESFQPNPPWSGGKTICDQSTLMPRSCHRTTVGRNMIV